MARRGPNGGGEKRDRILRAAVKIFSRKGFFNSKVSEIARAAEVADGTIYLYFRNKDDLLISLFEEKMGAETLSKSSGSSSRTTWISWSASPGSWRSSRWSCGRARSS
jgi:AcrR family transcriptional regulator